MLGEIGLLEASCLARWGLSESRSCSPCSVLARIRPSGRADWPSADQLWKIVFLSGRTQLRPLTWHREHFGFWLSPGTVRPRDNSISHFLCNLRTNLLTFLMSPCSTHMTSVLFIDPDNRRYVPRQNEQGSIAEEDGPPKVDGMFRRRIEGWGRPY
jgi:hypothetical protein